MKVLILNSVDNAGGAARAARRLCSNLVNNDVDAEMLVQRKEGTDIFVTCPSSGFHDVMAQLRPHLDASPVCLYPGRTRAIFSPAFLPESLRRRIVSMGPNLLHLHWVCEGFVRLETLKSLNLPVVWTLHDSWPFTGGCHLPSDCTRYEASCGNCPTLGSHRSLDLSSWVWKRKRKIFQNLNLTLVAPSSWMADKARSSSLFHSTRIEVIPNGLDLSVYKPHDRQSARQLLGLPQDKKILAFNAVAGCEDTNKGFALLKEAISFLKESGKASDCILLLVGSRLPEGTGIDIPSISIGRLTDDVSIVLAFSAADVTVVPSLQENLPYSVIESMACGTPCVAFRIGGIPEIIDHEKNGYLADPYNVSQFAEGISWVLHRATGSPLAENSCKKIDDVFSIRKVTMQYMKLYEELVYKRKS